MKEYKTVLRESSVEYTEKRSKFIGTCKSVVTEPAAIEFINQIKNKYSGASHNVYAYCLRSNQIKRCSDDKEPQGTAGIPALTVLLNNEVTDTVIVITRYFGGILLGSRGLVRAYTHCTKLAICASQIVTMADSFVCRITCNYSQYGPVSSILLEFCAVVEDSKFLERVEIVFYIQKDKFEALSKRLADKTNGQTSAEIVEEKFLPVSLI